MNGYDKGKLYVLAGGGSGGHLYPGLAVADAMQSPGETADMLFLCTEREIDERILQKSGYRYLTQPIRPLPGLSPPRVVEFWKRWRASMRMCEQLIRDHRPTAVLGLGGFASGPMIRTAAKYQVPIGILNPDARPGRANRFGKKYAKRIFVQWRETPRWFGSDADRCVLTGCPIRREIAEGAQGEKEKARHAMGLEANKRTLVVMGGSQGGISVNQAAVACLVGLNNDGGTNTILRNWQVLHLTGKNDPAWVRQQYRAAGIAAKVLEFSTRMELVLTAAELVIGRAGASSLAELTAVGVGSILLPYPYHKDRHQWANAEVLARAGAGRIVGDTGEAETTARGLAKAMAECIKDDELGRMAAAAAGLGRKNASRDVGDELRKMGAGSRAGDKQEKVR